MGRSDFRESYSCPYGPVNPERVADALAALGLTERQTPDLLLEAILILVDRQVPTWRIRHILCGNVEGRA